MANALVKKKKIEPKEPKRPVAEVRAENEKLKERLERLEGSCWCYMCGKHKTKDHFYVSTDPRIKSGYAPICRECARDLALRVDENGFEHEPTKESVKLALKYLNKPFLESVWNASMEESTNLTLGKTKTNVWTSMIKNIQMVQYAGMTWEDSDMFKAQKLLYEDEKTEEQIVEEHGDQDTYSSYKKNKSDVIRLLDYDPFEMEPLIDQPFLYSQLLGLLDASENANDDMMRVSAAITIVRGFLQLSKIDDAIAKLMGDIQSIADNSSIIRSLQDSKSKLTSNIKMMAEENCLSLKHNHSNTKGENSFTGKLKRLRDINLRESELNGFSIGCCKGMQQVANISMSAIIDKLAMDDSEWADIVKNQRIMVDQANRKATCMEEAFRILLRENLDMRKTMNDKGLIKESELIDLDDLLNRYVTSAEAGEQDEAV